MKTANCSGVPLFSLKVYAPFPFFQEFKNFLMIEAWSL